MKDSVPRILRKKHIIKMRAPFSAIVALLLLHPALALHHLDLYVISQVCR